MPHISPSLSVDSAEHSYGSANVSTKESNESEYLLYTLNSSLLQYIDWDTGNFALLKLNKAHTLLCTACHINLKCSP